MSRQRNKIHPAIGFILDMIDKEKLSRPKVAEAAGIRRETLHQWSKNKQSGNLSTVEAVLQVLGYTLIPKQVHGATLEELDKVRRTYRK